MAEQSAELYGRGKVIRFVTDGLDRSRNRDAPPLLLLIGPRGAGKTALLDRLEARHATGSPTARLDFGRAPDASPLAVMLDIGSMLSPGVARVGKVRLPLLGLGLIALGLDSSSDRSPAEQLDQILTARSGAFVRELGKDVGTLLPQREQQVMATELAAVIGWLMEGISRRRLGKSLQWYATSVSRGNGSRLGPLLRLHEWRESDSHGEVWRALCLALLADLRAEFNGATLTHGQRTTNCLVLLDNVDTSAGQDFLETLTECRKEGRKRHPDETDSLLVVAAQGTKPELHPAVDAPILATDDGLRHDLWLAEARRQEEHSSRWYPVFLTDLTVDNAEAIAGSHIFGRKRRDADFLHAVGGGHPVATWQFAGKLRQAERGFDPRELLELPSSPDDEDSVHGDPPAVGDYLLGRLRPDWLSDRDLDEMAVFAATLRPRLEAGASVFKFLGWLGVNELDVKHLFLSLMWADETPDDGLVIRPLPRLLLARRLAHDGELWEKTHDGFLTHYRTDQARRVAAEQYHLLALTTSPQSSQLGKVAACLDGQLGEKGSREWDAMLTDITAAPNRLRSAEDPDAGRWDLSGDQEDVVRWLAGLKESGDRLRTVTRLVAARWLGGDRLFDPAHRLARLIAGEYYELTQLVSGNCEVFYQEAERFRKIANDWEDRR